MSFEMDNFMIESLTAENQVSSIPTIDIDFINTASITDSEITNTTILGYDSLINAHSLGEGSVSVQNMSFTDMHLDVPLLKLSQDSSIDI